MGRRRIGPSVPSRRGGAEHQAEELDRQWRLRLDRARYEAKLAERRYKAVDPDNRNVARTVETDWEQQLAELAEVERGYEAARRQRKVALSDVDRAREFALGRDLSSVWRSPSATVAQRKALLRTLIAGVTLTPIDIPTRQTRVQILWEGGAVTEVVVARPRGTTPRSDEVVEDSIRRRAERGDRDVDIAQDLNSAGTKTAVGRPWTAMSVRRVRRKVGLLRAPTPPAPTQADGLYSTQGVAERFGVTRSTVSRWSRLGLVSAVTADRRGHSAWYRLDDECVRRIENDLGIRRTTRATEPVDGEAS